MRPSAPAATDIVLVGGGHAHVHVMAACGRQPEPGVRLTLVSKDLNTPYSGMLPGIVAGFYTREEAHIDLVKLADATGTRLIHATACGLDRAGRRLLLDGRPPLPFDLLSLDVGITPALDAIEGAAEHGIAVKPIGDFLEKFDRLIQAAMSRDGPRRIVVTGGGAAGVELTLSLRRRLRHEAAAQGLDPGAFSFALATAGDILETHNVRVRGAFRDLFAHDGIALHENRPAARIEAGAVHFADGGSIPADAVLVTTGAAAPQWLADTGLSVDDAGFVTVGPTLQSLNEPQVFAVGDCATLTHAPREKAGVYAVRAGPPLARNLRALARGETPSPWFPQKRHLALISTGARHAIASRGAFCASGRWLWTLKDRIDRRWMRQYRDLNGLGEAPGQDGA